MQPDDKTKLPQLFCLHEDSNANAALFDGRERLWAVAEERLSRVRFDGGFPQRSIDWLEQVSGVRLRDTKLAVCGNQTHFISRLFGSHFPSFEHDMFGLLQRLNLLYHHAVYRCGWFRRLMTGFNGLLARMRAGVPVRLIDHHTAHGYSAALASGFQDATVISVDNYGDGHSSRVFAFENGGLKFLYGSSALRSPGQFYGEMAQIAGINPLLAGKLTGLAAHGDPAPGLPLVSQLFGLRDDGEDFVYPFKLFASGHASPYRELAQLDRRDLAAATQQRFEEVMVGYAAAAVRRTGLPNVALAGGVFGNVRVNQLIAELPQVQQVYVFPAMSDQGIAVGAGLAYLAQEHGLRSYDLPSVYIGPDYDEQQIEQALIQGGLSYSRPADIADEAAAALMQGNVVVRYAGALEYGPRALGHRTIMYRPDDYSVNDWLNHKLHRNEYMPFAPVIMAQHADRMLRNPDLAPRAARLMTVSFHATDELKRLCPGVIHVDGTVRPQILYREDEPQYYAILERWHQLSGVPCLINTSFNMHEEPIVCSPQDAVRAFIAAGLPRMICGPFWVTA
ncbi:MAG: carbamoyltransferase C-terminal domain-containing protein [Candidatus Alcyoniella australis]|nr:carbamoyltransferase C-terminal domain-containing protein [Candidatus Alcyoniella australis]